MNTKSHFRIEMYRFLPQSPRKSTLEMKCGGGGAPGLVILHAALDVHVLVRAAWPQAVLVHRQAADLRADADVLRVRRDGWHLL